MKTSTLRIGFLSLGRSFFKPFSHLISLSLILALALCYSCTPKVSDALNLTPAGTETHVAFAGGGWRAHTGHSAWVMSLLQANSAGCALNSDAGNPACLQAAFANVKTISGNSGGSWFSSMLMYDRDFINQITSKSARTSWGAPTPSPTQGWLGKQKYFFSGFSGECGKHTGDLYLACVVDEYYAYGNKDLSPDWSLFVSDLVYKDYNWQSYGNLSSNTKQAWATDKSLLMAATILTNSTVLNDKGGDGDEIYYQVCNIDDNVKLDGDDGGSCEDKNKNTVSMPDVIPVTFTSLAASSGTLQPPGFITTRTTGYKLGYSGAYLTTKTPINITQLYTNGLRMDDVPVMWAAASSSAATGYTASMPVLSPKHMVWDEMYHARNLAIGFKFPDYSNGQGLYTSNTSIDIMNLNELNNQRVMRLADGGAVDNSGVAQLISYLQLNNKANGFNIVAFDDVQSNDSSDPSKYPSSDISYLFESPTGNQITFAGYTITVPPLAILDGKLVSKYTWTVVNPTPGKPVNKLHYYIYRVSTKDNGNFNINSGSQGVIHVFSSKFGLAATGPDNKGAFDAYESMIQNFAPTLANRPDGQTTGASGLEMLKNAFGL